MEAAELMKITSHELLEMDVVDKVISEAGLSSKELIKNVKKELQAELARLSQKPLEALLEERINDLENTNTSEYAKTRTGSQF